MAAEGAITTTRFPIRLLTIAFVLTAVTFAWFGWVIFDSNRDAKTTRDRSTHMEELRGVILLYDEVLSGSVRLAVTTGDLTWEELYRRFEPQLDAAISEVKGFAANPSSARAAAQTDEANIKLVEMENRAFALVRAGSMEEAHAVVFSPEYEKEKQIYAQGSALFIDQIRRDVDELERQDKSLDFLSLIGALVVLAISFAAWLSVVRGLQRWRTDLEQAVGQRKQAEQALRGANDELEVRVTARTAELGKTNEALQTENTVRKQTEEALRRSEERFRIAAETANDVVYEWDLKQSVEWMGNIDGLLGYEPGEFSRTLDGWAALVHPEDLERTMASLQAHLEGRAPYAIEYRVRRKDAVYRWWSARGAAARTPDGKPTRMIGSITDITEPKQAEAALRASEAEFRALAEAMPQMVWITRPDGWNIYISQQWMDYTGLTLVESLGHGWNKPFHPEDQQRAWDAWQHATTTGGIYSIESRLRRADGAYRWWLIRGVPQKDTNGNILKWFGTCTDIHDLKSAELEISRANEALSESKHFAESIAENSTSTIYVFDLETRRTVYSNHNPGESLGYSPAQLIELGENILPTILHPEDLPRIAEQLARFAGVPDSRVLDIEYRVKHASGDWHWMWARETVFTRRPNGTPRQILGTAQDITERKRAEAELERAHQELVKASRLAGMAEFATGVLHNVGNVLNSVNVATTCMAGSLKKSKSANLAKVVALMRQHEADLGNFLAHDPKGMQVIGFLAQLADHLAGEQATALKELGEVQVNIEHIKHIITAQQDSAKATRLREVLNLTELAEECLKMNANGLQRGGIQVIKEFEEVPPIMTEKHLVLQILVNLMRNSMQACEASGSPEKRLTIRISQGADRVRIAVADNGSGILAENLPRIFAHGYTTKKEGHGFGLHSAAIAAKEMGGSLTAHSDGSGQGATFTLELPYAPNRAQLHNLAGHAHWCIRPMGLV